MGWPISGDGELKAFLLRGLRAASNSEAVVSHFAATIRRASKNIPTIGENLMSIVLPYPHKAPVQISFSAIEDHKVAINRLSSTELYNTSYSPWIIGPSSLFAPALHTGFETQL
jgi:hypothetical protein